MHETRYDCVAVWLSGIMRIRCCHNSAIKFALYNEAFRRRFSYCCYRGYSVLGSRHVGDLKHRRKRKRSENLTRNVGTRPNVTRPLCCLCYWRRLTNTADNLRSEIWYPHQISWRYTICHFDVIVSALLQDYRKKWHTPRVCGSVIVFEFPIFRPIVE